ncbi:MAG: LuxR C-terminal-related transcriptional regulator [Treponema sp.]|nr:LuxR C-terminal-related transcriptional regulator [Treponema sp.]
MKQALGKQLITVIAGAGYGKTQAVYAFVQKIQQKFQANTTWMQLSNRDNIEERFWESFVAVVENVNGETAKHLAENGFPGSDRLFERYLSIPRKEVDPEKRYVFVYDDFHLLKNEAVLRFMERNLNTLFPNISSIVISRRDIGINTARIEDRKQAARITEEDLRFTEEETAEYFRIQRLSVSPQFLSMVNRETEGWAFAIHLATLSLKNIPNFGSETAEALHVLPAMRSNIFKLIESEILENISPELRKFFITLSLIEEFSRELLTVLASNTFGEAFSPDEAEAKLAEGGIGSFVHYDKYHKAYRIHHLLLDYLGRQQGELSKEEMDRVYLLAADWYSKNNRKMDAIAYYEKAGDFDAIIRELYSLPLLLTHHMARFLLDLLYRIPEAMYLKNPVLYILRNRAMISLTLFEETEAELKTTIPRLETALDYASGAEKAMLHRAISGCYMNLGFIALICSGRRRNYSYAWLFEQGAAHGRLSGYVSKPPVSVAVVGFYACRTENPDKEEVERYISAIEAFEPCMAEVMGGCYRGSGDLARAELAFFRADSAGAERYAKEAVRKAREAGQYEIENRALFYLARIYLSWGNFGDFRRVWLELGELREKPYYLNRFSQCDIVEGWFAVQLGFTGQLAGWLKNDFAESELNSLANGLEILIKAKYHFIEKKYPAALAVLESRKDTEGNLVLGKIENLVLMAVCRYSARDQEGAYAALAEAYVLAEPNGYLMPFTELGRCMRALADSALRDGAASLPRDWLLEIRRGAAAYAKRIFAAREAFGPAGQGPAGTLGLSRREQEVLYSLSRGLTREEIASSLIISINTVKSVISSIYSKLGAQNRAEAVHIATSRGILQAGSPKQALDLPAGQAGVLPKK